MGGVAHRRGPRRGDRNVPGRAHRGAARPDRRARRRTRGPEEGEDPAPSAGGTAAGEAAQELGAELAELHGAFEHGYGADDIRRVFGRINDEGGPYLVCVWDIADDYGFGGNADFYAEDEECKLFELKSDVYRWLTGQQDSPGPLDTWVGGHVPELVEFAATDDRHNYARTER